MHIIMGSEGHNAPEWLPALGLWQRDHARLLAHNLALQTTL